MCCSAVYERLRLVMCWFKCVVQFNLCLICYKIQKMLAFTGRKKTSCLSNVLLEYIVLVWFSCSVDETCTNLYSCMVLTFTYIVVLYSNVYILRHNYLVIDLHAMQLTFRFSLYCTNFFLDIQNHFNDLLLCLSTST